MVLATFVSFKITPPYYAGPQSSRTNFSGFELDINELSYTILPAEHSKLSTNGQGEKNLKYRDTIPLEGIFSHQMGFMLC